MLSSGMPKDLNTDSPPCEVYNPHLEERQASVLSRGTNPNNHFEVQAKAGCQGLPIPSSPHWFIQCFKKYLLSKKTLLSIRDEQLNKRDTCLALRGISVGGTDNKQIISQIFSANCDKSHEGKVHVTTQAYKRGTTDEGVDVRRL